MFQFGVRFDVLVQYETRRKITQFVITREKIGVGENTCKEEVLAFGVSEIVYAMLGDAS